MFVVYVDLILRLSPFCPSNRYMMMVTSIFHVLAVGQISIVSEARSPAIPTVSRNPLTAVRSSAARASGLRCTPSHPSSSTAKHKLLKKPRRSQQPLQPLQNVPRKKLRRTGSRSLLLTLTSPKSEYSYFYPNFVLYVCVCVCVCVCVFMKKRKKNAK